MYLLKIWRQLFIYLLWALKSQLLAEVAPWLTAKEWVQDSRSCKGLCQTEQKRSDSTFQFNRQNMSPPFLTGSAFVDLRVRSPSEELHRDPPELGDHCNGSQEAVSIGPDPGLSPPHAPRTPLPALSTCGRKARCSLCSSDKSSSILAEQASSCLRHSAPAPPSPLPASVQAKRSSGGAALPMLWVPVSGGPTGTKSQGSQGRNEGGAGARLSKNAQIFHS